MLGKSSPGLQRLGASAAHRAPREFSHAKPTAAPGMQRLGAARIGAGKARKVELSFSHAKPSPGALASSRVGMPLLAGRARRAAKPRPKKQTGVPLRALWLADSAPVSAAQRASWVAPAAQLLAAPMPWAVAAEQDASSRVGLARIGLAPIC